MKIPNFREQQMLREATHKQHIKQKQKHLVAKNKQAAQEVLLRMAKHLQISNQTNEVMHVSISNRKGKVAC